MPGLNAIPSSRRPDMDDIWLVMEQRAEPMAAEIADHVHVLGFHEGLDCGPDVAGGATWPDRRNAAKTASCHVGPYWSNDGRSWPIPAEAGIYTARQLWGDKLPAGGLPGCRLVGQCATRRDLRD
jgi:hypothetical protein